MRNILKKKDTFENYVCKMSDILWTHSPLQDSDVILNYIQTSNSSRT